MPTALELGRDGWRPFIAALSRRPAHSGPTLSERSKRLRLLKRIRNAAAVLKAEFGARRVILFGSIAHEAWFTSDSDVDLAVEGLITRYPEGVFFLPFCPPPPCGMRSLFLRGQQKGKRSPKPPRTLCL